MPLFLLANPITSLLGGVSLLLLIGVGVQTYRLSMADTAVATAQKNQAEAEKQAADINRIFSENDAKNERARADQAVKSAAELQQIQTHATTLQATLNRKQRDFDTTNAQLQDMVAHVAPVDRRELGPVMLSVIGQLRQQQQARDAGGDYSSSGGH
jgi:seryl-tRNA synthetase